MSAPPSRRTRLSRYQQLGARFRVYRVDGALEVDELSAYDVLRRRVLFDEAILMTRHRQRPWLMIAIAVLFGTVFLLSGLAFSGSQLPAWAIGFFIPAGLAGLYILGRLIVPIHVLTLYSPRSKARLEFSTDGGAGEAWQELERAIAEAQAA